MKDLTYELNVSVLQFSNVKMILAFGSFFHVTRASAGSLRRYSEFIFEEKFTWNRDIS